MKFAVAIALAGAVASQQLNDLPQCGQMCINNMITIANTQFGCASGDVKCYCNDPRFKFGLNDCTGQACGSNIQQQVNSFGKTYCANAGVPNPGSGPATGSGSGGASATGSAGPSNGASGSASATDSGASSASNAVSSAKSSASSAASSINSALSSVTSSAANAASSGAKSSSSSSGNAAVMTAAPMAGALGFAAMLLI